MADVGERPSWDDARARSLLGRHVLVGLTFERPNGEVIDQVQLHGTVARVEAHHGIGIERGGTGELFWLPPDPASFEEAAVGEYAYARRVKSWSTQICSRPGRSPNQTTTPCRIGV
jgi:hypothetical protein